MARSRGNRRRSIERHALRLLKKMERRRIFSEGWWDTEVGELVSRGYYPLNNVLHGEVLFDNRGFVSPALEVSPEVLV